MGEAQSGFDKLQNGYEQDQTLASVMPDSWIGFARMRIHERGLSGKKRSIAERASEKLLAKHDGLSAKVAAEHSIKCLDEKAGLIP